MNYSKSCCSVEIGRPRGVRIGIKEVLGVDKESGDGLYLGLPELVGRNKRATFSRVKDRVNAPQRRIKASRLGE